MIEEWYLQEILPKPSWMLKCYHRAYMAPEDAFEILKATNEVLSDEKNLTLYFLHTLSYLDRYGQAFPDTLDDYYKMVRERKEVEELRKQYDTKEETKRLKKKELMLIKAKNIDSNSSRNEIIRTMYGLNEVDGIGYSHLFSERVYSEEQERYIDQAVAFGEFEREMEKYDLSGIVKNIKLYIDYDEGLIDRFEYSSLSRKYSKTKEQVEMERKEQEELEKTIKEFHHTYPKFEKNGIEYDVKRGEVNAQLFEYNTGNTSFIKFQGKNKHLSLDELLEELHSLLEE